MYFQKPFTELKNLESLLRYNMSKLAPIRTFFPRTSGNFSRKLRFSHFEILLFWLMLTLRIPFHLKLYFMSMYRHSGDTDRIVDHLYNYTHWLLDHPHSVILESVKTTLSCIIYVSININLHQLFVKKVQLSFQEDWSGGHSCMDKGFLRLVK